MPLLIPFYLLINYSKSKMAQHMLQLKAFLMNFIPLKLVRNNPKWKKSIYNMKKKNFNPMTLQ